MTINRIFKILTKQQKARLSILVIFQLLASMLDAIGIISLLPFLTLILDPGQLSDDGYLSDIYNYFKYQYDFM